MKTDGTDKWEKVFEKLSWTRMSCRKRTEIPAYSAIHSLFQTRIARLTKDKSSSSSSIVNTSPTCDNLTNEALMWKENDPIFYIQKTKVFTTKKKEKCSYKVNKIPTKSDKVTKQIHRKNMEKK